MPQSATRTYRGSHPVAEQTVAHAAVAVGGAVIALAAGVAVALWLGTQMGVQSFWIAIAPLAAWVIWVRRRAEAALQASAPREIVATERRLRVGDREHRVTSAAYSDGVLRLRTTYGLALIAVRAPLIAARDLTDALGVRELGVRTVAVWGPLASIPVLGMACMTIAPAVATFAALVLLFASHLASGPAVVFAGLALVGSSLTVLALTPRTLRALDDRIELHWLGRTRSYPLVALESIALDRDAIVLSIRGERPRRLPLVPVSTTTSASLADGRREATRRAEGPITLASTTKIANVFE